MKGTKSAIDPRHGSTRLPRVAARPTTRHLFAALALFIACNGSEPAPAPGDFPARGDDARPPNIVLFIVDTLRAQQRADGGWGQFPGSGVDLSATVKGYFVLKLYGDDPDAPHMRRARERVRELGGAERVNTWTNFFLACLGQVSWNAVPAIPPEVVMLPRWFYFHLDKVAAWTRTMILPLSLVMVIVVAGVLHFAGIAPK